MTGRKLPIWLDSADDNGWEILSCAPEKILTQPTSAKQAVLIEATDAQFCDDKNYGKQQQLDEEALEWLDAHLGANLTAQRNIKPRIEQEAALHAELPFTGGWIGLLSYEAGQSLEGLRSDYQQKTPVLNDELVFAYYSWAILIDHRNKCAYLFSENEAPCFTQQFDQLIARYELAQTNSQDIQKGQDNPSFSHQTSFKLVSEIHNNTSRDQYAQSFASIQQYLSLGDCYQVNYTQRFQANYQGHAVDAYLSLRKQLKAPFSCYFRWRDYELLSFSPERFIKLDGKQLITEPIKGTSPRYADPIEDTQSRYHLKSSQKDQAENLMIVDLLRNDLSRISKPKSVIVEELFGLYSFTNVHHLISRISSEIANRTKPVDIIKHCFPGGSITGAPKKRAMEIINELEINSRDVYCGSMFVFSNNGRVDSNILIRTLLCQKGTLYCWAGGGIVADSDEQTEYQECFSKVNAIFEALKAVNP